MLVLTNIATKEREKALKLKRIRFKFDDQKLTLLARVVALGAVFLCWNNADILQLFVNKLWSFLKTQPWYQTVYNETLFVVLWSFPAMLPYKLIDKFSFFHKYRIKNADNMFESFNAAELIWEAVEYCSPLMLLDTFHVKHYAGVTNEVIERKRLDFIQITRALPESPPLVEDMVRHLLVALFFYDLLFFLQHYTFHKVPYLYRKFHKKHHTHPIVNVKVTNRLHVVERLALILSANFGLKIQGAHPLTRSLFIIVFIVMLIDNHSGYEFPWGYHKIIPAGLVAGPRKHYLHHVYSDRSYQPILTYIDYFLEKRRLRSSKKSKSG